jgi:hypothetical protein
VSVVPAHEGEPDSSDVDDGRREGAFDGQAGAGVLDAGRVQVPDGLPHAVQAAVGDVVGTQRDDVHAAFACKERDRSRIDGEDHAAVVLNPIRQYRALEVVGADLAVGDEVRHLAAGPAGADVGHQPAAVVRAAVLLVQTKSVVGGRAARERPVPALLVGHGLVAEAAVRAGVAG